MVLHLKHVVREFLNQIMASHIGDIGEFVKGPHPQGYISGRNANMIMGILPRELIPNETITLHMEHLLDVQNFERNEERQKGITK